MKPDKWGMKFYICAESNTSYVLNSRICGETASIEKTVTDLTSPYAGKYIGDYIVAVATVFH